MLACNLPVLPDVCFRHDQCNRHERLSSKHVHDTRGRLPAIARAHNQRHAIARTLHPRERRFPLPQPRKSGRGEPARLRLPDPAKDASREHHPHVGVPEGHEAVGVAKRRGLRAENRLQVPGDERNGE